MHKVLAAYIWEIILVQLSIRMQHDPSYECFFFLADLHAITINRPPLGITIFRAI